jgi:hypothetical protein
MDQQQQQRAAFAVKQQLLDYEINQTQTLYRIAPFSRKAEK